MTWSQGGQLYHLDHVWIIYRQKLERDKTFRIKAMYFLIKGSIPLISVEFRAG